MKKDEKAKEAFAGVSEFWNSDDCYKLIAAENHHDELFLIEE